MNAATINAIFQGIRFLSELAERYSNGELTDAEVQAELADMRIRLAAANRMWEDAGG